MDNSANIGTSSIEEYLTLTVEDLCRKFHKYTEIQKAILNVKKREILVLKETLDKKNYTESLQDLSYLYIPPDLINELAVKVNEIDLWLITLTFFKISKVNKIPTKTELDEDITKAIKGFCNTIVDYIRKRNKYFRNNNIETFKYLLVLRSKLAAKQESIILLIQSLYG